jgi:hypothetical protein
VKVLLIFFFFYLKGVVHHEFVLHSQAVNGQFYLEVMKHSWKALQRKRPEVWKNKTWMLHHDNALAHTSFHIREFLAMHETILILQLPYSPDLASADCFLFPELKSTLEGRRFQMIEEL